ncbi:hypothetical protein C8R21_12219 [Nitrosospira multiformis]|uniref:Uncharacterized protein n=1 Tax=Nitrosospira multiformis TaxID=1231 RepID=A0A2T5I7L3_9PROT|nr:hypothetical protein [Nitrosospira multiformis]PTQ79815.1 hypothetical protein C8R21_12219 [Nitrosospira multiformis]
MIDPLGVSIIFSFAGIDPPSVPVKALLENQLTRRAYTFLELPSTYWYLSTLGQASVAKLNAPGGVSYERNEGVKAMKEVYVTLAQDERDEKATRI